MRALFMKLVRSHWGFALLLIGLFITVLGELYWFDYTPNVVTHTGQAMATVGMFLYFYQVYLSARENSDGRFWYIPKWAPRDTSKKVPTLLGWCLFVGFLILTPFAISGLLFVATGVYWIGYFGVAVYVVTASVVFWSLCRAVWRMGGWFLRALVE